MFGSLECNIYLCTRNQEMIATISRSGAVVARWAHNPKVVSSSLASATKERGCPKSRIAPFAIVYFGKKYYLTVAKNKHYSNG